MGLRAPFCLSFIVVQGERGPQPEGGLGLRSRPGSRSRPGRDVSLPSPRLIQHRTHRPRSCHQSICQKQPLLFLRHRHPAIVQRAEYVYVGMHIPAESFEPCNYCTMSKGNGFYFFFVDKRNTFILSSRIISVLPLFRFIDAG